MVMIVLSDGVIVRPLEPLFECRPKRHALLISTTDLEPSRSRTRLPLSPSSLDARIASGYRHVPGPSRRPYYSDEA